eukprot:1263999-Pleurochrysis_carterae.AAC.1
MEVFLMQCRVLISWRNSFTRLYRAGGTFNTGLLFVRSNARGKEFATQCASAAHAAWARACVPAAACSC